MGLRVEEELGEFWGKREDGSGGVQVDYAEAMGHSRGGNRRIAGSRHTAIDEPESDAPLHVPESLAYSPLDVARS